MPSRRTVPAWTSATTALALLLGVLLPVVVAGLVTGLTLSAAPAQAAMRTAEDATLPADADPLGVTIDSLTPSALKTDSEHGTVRVAGTVTNNDDEAWKALNVYAFIGSTPLTTEAELTAATASDPTAQVGERITTYGEFATLPDLAPGASGSFEIAIPRADLHGDTFGTISTPGVYWFGVQVLGNTADGARDNEADGRARTFLPLVARPGHTDPVPASIVVPLRQRVLRGPDGSIAAVAGWARTLSPGGRLWNLLDFAAGRPVSWLIDPAVLDAVQQLAEGNPVRSIAATDGTGTDSDNGDNGDNGEDGSPAPSSTPPSPVAPSSASISRALNRTADPQAATDAAKAWLARLLPTLKQSPSVYALPYGDLDLSAAARHDPGLYAVARERSTAVLGDLGVSALPLDAPPTGYLQSGAVRLGESSAPLLLSDHALSGTVPTVATIDGRTVYTSSSLVAGGGPAPGRQLSPVAIRQQLLAQASMRLPTRTPVLVLLPTGWIAGGAAGADPSGFFTGLEQPWLQLNALPGTVANLPARPVATTRLHYPDAELGAELPTQVFTAVDDLRNSGDRLQALLPHNDTVGAAVLDDALTSASYTARGAMGAAGTAAMRTRYAIDAQLRSVTVEAPPSVTLASDQGKFNATVVNNLDQPVQVTLRSTTDGDVTITGPRRLEIQAHGRTGVLLAAHAHTNGVHNVRLQLATTNGKLLGSQTSFPIRTAQVSRIIWLFIGGGVGLLFAAIVIRLVRRIRNRGTDPDPTIDPTTDPVADPTTHPREAP